MSIEQTLQQLVEAQTAHTAAVKEQTAAMTLLANLLKAAGTTVASASVSAKPGETADQAGERVSKELTDAGNADRSAEQQTQTSAAASAGSSRKSTKTKDADKKTNAEAEQTSKPSGSDEKGASLPAPTPEELAAKLRPWLNEHAEGSDEREARKKWLMDALKRVGCKKVTEADDDGRKKLVLWIDRKLKDPSFNVADSFKEDGEADDELLG
ncbi:hypothetical protein D3C72_685780 [compost metagenome]